VVQGGANGGGVAGHGARRRPRERLPQELCDATVLFRILLTTRSVDADAATDATVGCGNSRGFVAAATAAATTAAVAILVLVVLGGVFGKDCIDGGRSGGRVMHVH
jgi:hypothetical protein